MNKLSDHFSLSEFVRSNYAIRNGLDNRPPLWVYDNLTRVAETLELVRKALGNKPIIITSGYRSPLVNKGVGGSRNSAHCKGLAVDFDCPKFGTPLDVSRKIIEAGIEYDQLIHEGAWVHLAIPAHGERARRQVLTAHFKGGGVYYTSGLPV